ncbi:VOC family protein [Paenirhodobacter sp.]|uniref:VOC family protein n=1 Tax=Paenirhodobacter sp. TaxID=1965326 RepID=UPI003B5052E5
MTTGIHHVTALTADIQANVDFYIGFLGLRLVKRTAGFEDAQQLHLFYGDAAGSPGSVLSFLAWEGGASGRVGIGQVSEIAFAVPPASIGSWLTRALSARVPVEGPMRELGETVLRLKDPDGIIVKLVGADLPSPAPLGGDAPTRIRSVTLLTDDEAASQQMLERFGYRPGPRAGAILRMVSESDVIDLRAVAGYVPGIPGAGTFDHVALRAPDRAAVQAAAATLPGEVNMHDRTYFYSLYVRDTAGILYEYASDTPGFAVNEAPALLGTTLFMPPGASEDLEVMLPQFALPDAERWPRRKLLFAHRLYTPDAPDDTVLIALHGSGGSETSLLPLAHRIAPHARLIGLRGRATEEGVPRWFRRFGYREFDQGDIRAEAAAFAAFLPDLAKLYAFDLAQAVFLGDSNGANFLGAVLRLHPGLVQRAILLRGQEVLADAPAQAAGSVLMVNGRLDLLVGPAAGELEAALRAGGASVEAVTVAAGHGLAEADATAARAWLEARRDS